MITFRLSPDFDLLFTHLGQLNHPNFWQSDLYSKICLDDLSLGIFEKNGSLVGLTILRLKKKLGIPFYFINQGPLFVPSVSLDDKFDCLKLLSKRKLPFLNPFFILSPNPLDPDLTEDFLKRAGFFKLKSVKDRGTFCVDLSQSEEILRKNLNGKWRNQLVKSEKMGLKFKSDPALFNQVLKQYRQFQDQKGFSGFPLAQLERMAFHQSSNSTIHPMLVYDEHQTILGGALFAKYGRGAIYLLGFQTPESRGLNTGNFYMWQAMLLLKGLGVVWLDLGGYNRISTPSIAKFKEGLGGKEFPSLGYFG